MRLAFARSFFCHLDVLADATESSVDDKDRSGEPFRSPWLIDTMSNPTGDALATLAKRELLEPVLAPESAAQREQAVLRYPGSAEGTSD